MFVSGFKISLLRPDLSHTEKEQKSVKHCLLNSVLL